MALEHVEKRIGIVGAGVMGKGSAQRFAQYGYDITLYDVDSNTLSEAVKSIYRNLKLQSFMNKSIEPDAIIARILICKDYSAFSEVDYVIENVYERIDVKRSVYVELEKKCKEACIYLVNTSCIPISLIGSFTSREDRVVGVHLMNPVPMKDFCEVIRGEKTSERTIESVGLMLENAGISCEVIHDSPGFVSNRLSHLLMNEAISLVEDGVAEVKQVDTIMEKAFLHKMGPLATADLIGLDVVLDSLNVLYELYQDDKFRPRPLLKKLVEEGLLGRKCGHGFYDYRNKS